MNEVTLRNMTVDELVRAVDADPKPTVRELALLDALLDAQQEVEEWREAAKTDDPEELAEQIADTNIDLYHLGIMLDMVDDLENEGHDAEALCDWLKIAAPLYRDLCVWMDEHDCATVGELREAVEPVIDVESDYFGTEDEGNG